jgi:hypothetical protein
MGKVNFIPCIRMAKCSVFFFVFSILVQCLFAYSSCCIVRLIELGDNFSQLLFIQWLSLTTVQIRRHIHFDYFDFITLFIDMYMSFYTINLNVISLFIDLSFFIFSRIKILHNLICSTNFEWIYISCFSKTKIIRDLTSILHFAINLDWIWIKLFVKNIHQLVGQKNVTTQA